MDTMFFKDKVGFYDHCLKNNIPTPAILSVINVNGNLNYTEDGLSLPERDFFLKTVDGDRGIGAAKFYYRNNQYEDIHGKIYEPEDVINFLNNSEYDSVHHTKGKFIVQPILENHKDWRAFTSGALATCRILTGRQLGDGKIIPIAASLRMPTGSAIVDNFSGGGIASPIDMNTGELGTSISFKPKNGSFEIDFHPDTGQKISGTVLPGWNKLLEFTSRVHKTFDLIFVGWDISYTRKGFVVIEGNANWGEDLVESPQNCPLSITQYPVLFNQWVHHFSNGYEN